MADTVATTGIYFWMQTWGRALVQAGTTTIDVGLGLQGAEDDDGAAQIAVLAEAGQVIGFGLQDGADGIWAPVFLQIIP